MRISSVQNFSIMKNYAASKKQCSTPQTQTVSQTLPAESYGQDLVSFKAKAPNGDITKKLSSIPFENKLAYALDNIVDINEFLVVAKNADKVKDVLKRVSDRIKLPIESIIWLKEPKIDESLLFFARPNGDKTLVNVNDRVLPLDITGLFPDESTNLEYGNEVRLSKVWYQIKSTEDIPIEERKLIDENYDKLMLVYNCSAEADKTVEDFNQKIIENFMAETKPADLKKNVKFGFAQVGGQDGLIDRLKKNVLFPLKYPEAFEGLMVNKGVILYGPPGTGKTLLAKALAAEANASVFELCATDLEAKYVGESEANCRELFKKAVDAQPSIICFDEFDALGKSRGGADVHGDKLLNQLLSLMSDIEKQKDKVVVIGSTNRKDSLDPAVLRSGRFDLQLEVKAPDLKGTKQILDIKLRGKPVDKMADLEGIAKKMFAKKMTGADITAVVRDAHINALERSGIYKSMEEGRFTPAMMDYFKISEEDFQKAIDDFKQQPSGRNPIGYNK